MFDTPSELLDKIRLGEDSQLELKAVTVGAKGLLAMFDETPVPGAGIESLDQELAGRFIEGTEEAPESIYQKMGVLTLDAQGNLVCSVAGVLMATRRPDQLLHGGACIEAVHYAGTERDSDMQVSCFPTAR